MPSARSFISFHRANTWFRRTIKVNGVIVPHYCNSALSAITRFDRQVLSIDVL